MTNETIYPEMQQVAVVRDNHLSDAEIEHFIEKAGYFEYEEQMTRERSDRMALRLVLEARE